MPELTARRRQLVLVICCLSLFIVGLDNTVVNLALPSIGRDLSASVSSLQWTIDGYTVVLASLLMLGGSTGDRIGRRRAFQLGLMLFSIGSLLCSLAPSVGLLVAARMVQAVGGCMLNPVALAIVTNTFTDPKERARAIGVWAGVFGLSMALGPVVGGVLVDSTGWRSVFWLNVPIGIVAITLTALFIPESRAERPRRLDPVGQVLVIALLGSVTYGIIEGPSAGFGSARIVGCFVVSGLALAGLLYFERRRAQPLLELRLFRSVPFAGATLLAISGFAALSGFLFLNSIYLQDVRHFTPLHAGLLTLPMAVMTAIAAPLSGRIVAVRGTRLPVVIAGVGIALAGVLLSWMANDTPIALLIAAYVVFGIGNGMLNPPITNTAVSSMPRAQAGVAAAVTSTSRQVGTSLGVAVLGTVVTAHVRYPLATGFASATHLGWWIMAGCGVLVVALGMVTTGRWARRTARVVAEQFGEVAVGEQSVVSKA